MTHFSDGFMSELERRAASMRAKQQQTPQGGRQPRFIPAEARQYLIDERHAKTARLDAIRNDPELRVTMVKLIPRLYALLDELAYETTSDPFTADRLMQRMLWQLSEYVGQSLEDDPRQIVRACQLTEGHAAAWWDVETVYHPSQDAGDNDDPDLA